MAVSRSSNIVLPYCFSGPLPPPPRITLWVGFGGGGGWTGLGGCIITGFLASSAISCMRLGKLTVIESKLFDFPFAYDTIILTYIKYLSNYDHCTFTSFYLETSSISSFARHASISRRA